MQLWSSCCDNHPSRNASKPPPNILVHSTNPSTPLHMGKHWKINWQMYVDMCLFTSNAHIDGRAFCAKLSGFADKWTSRQFHSLLWKNTYYTHPGISLHSQSQIRWQIRRLMLPGGCGWGPPLLQAVPQHTYKSHAQFTVGFRQESHTHPSRRYLKSLPFHKSAGIFFHYISLFYSSLRIFLPASLLLPSAASQPIRCEVTSPWCSQFGGRTMNVCDGKERKTHRHFGNIKKASLCFCQTS